MEYYSAISKNEIMPFVATWMDLEIILLSEVKSERERQIPYIIYMWSIKYDTNRNRLTGIENKFMITKGRGCGEKGILLHSWWECKLVQPLRRTVWRFLKKLKIELPYDPAIPLLGIYPEKNLA